MDIPEKPEVPLGGQLSRRTFLGTTAAAAAGLLVVPRHVVGATPQRKAPSDTLNIGCVGVGGKGFSDIQAASTETIAALCDVDDMQMADFLRSDQHEPEKKAMYEKAAKYRDWRRMLEKEKGLDAITVSTPDHNHAVVAMASLKLGKHVFVQKPLTHTVKEARLLAKVARETKLTTQMGNQGHAKEGARLLNEWIWAGAIGNVMKVDAWTDRPIWLQGNQNAPREIPAVPSTLDWDVWIGPSPFRPYHPSYHPFSWRGLWDFGTGSLGDMGAHILDQPFWALDLGAPETVQASSSAYSKDYYPAAQVVTYKFPARGKRGPVELTWWDAGLMPPRPDVLEPGRMMGEENNGCLFHGDKGDLMCGVYGENPRLIPETAMQAFVRPEKTIPRSPGIMEEWIAAIKAGKKSTTDFAEFSGPLTEVMLLANIAVRMKEKNTVLRWDSEKFTFSNMPEADQFLHFDYRPGWSL